ncbi:Uncharacterised protein [Mycobacteroides abscessus subsp. abscessus]|nr:Uncharacterised protein [Mycobacteroides abscessus subsp. abscessus]
MDVVQCDADTGHDVGDDADHDIGVEGAQQHRQTSGAYRDAAMPQRQGSAGLRRCVRHWAGLSTVTGLPQSDNDISIVLPGEVSTLILVSAWLPSF